VNASKPIKLQDIADRAGVCRATVSLALRNHPSLPLVTRTRIQDLARELGYRPHPLVAALMTYKRALRSPEPTGTTIAFVLNFSSRGPWQSYLT
jgi:LacI family fructose operon transcriptional repressor